MSIERLLFDKSKKNADRTVRCYLTLDCTSNCWFCSAGVPSLSKNRKEVWIPAEVWAKGLNRRARDTILAGGELFLYPEFGKLIGLLEPTYKIEIATNLQCDVESFLESAKRKFSFMVSLHPTTKDLEVWYKRVELLADAGHTLRFHVVRVRGYERLASFLEQKGIVGRFRTALQGDQRVGIKSKGMEVNRRYPLVRCSGRIFLFGPDGYRYMCVTKLGQGMEEGRFEHISELDGPDWHELKCTNFGNCVACDNNIEGKVLWAREDGQEVE